MLPITDVRSAVQPAAASETDFQSIANNSSTLYPPVSSNVGKISCNPIIYNPTQWRKQYDVSQLDKAEQLSQQGYQESLSGNLADKLEGQKDMDEANQIRQQVEADLNPQQRQQLEQLNNEEQQAFTTGATSDNSFLGQIERAISSIEMADGASQSKQLDNSIQGNHKCPPDFPPFPWGNVIKPLF